MAPKFFLKDKPCNPGPPYRFIELFESARKAIECGNVTKFSSTLDGMAELFKRKPSKSEMDDGFIDACIVSTVVSKHTRKRSYFLMSLLAYAAIHNQRTMADILISRNASTWITGKYCGSPITLMLTYALHHGCPEMIDYKMIKFLIKSIPEDKLSKETEKMSNFDNNTAYHIIVGKKANERNELCSPVELAIQLQRTDIAKQFVQAGANPICVSDATEQILPLLLEFFEFGTNHYMSWLLHEHLHPHEISGFIEQVLEKGPMIFSNYAKKEFKEEAGRHHVHGLLTCGHKQMIKEFIERYPESDGEDMLRVKDSADRTALQVAAANGDLESVHTLLSEYTEWVNRPDDGIDIAKALLAAAKANHIKIVDFILRKDDDAFQDDSKLSVLHVEINGLYTWKIAVFEELSCIFETLRHYDQRIIGESFDDKGNTLGHITAKSGNANLFKVVFPLVRRLPSHMVKECDKKDDYSMFWALVLENGDKETPLMVAIDNNHNSILESLQDRAIEREQRQNAKQNKEKTEWENFWKENGRKLLLYACSRSLESVKMLVNITKSTIGYLPETWTVEAFKGSIDAGNDDVVNYFLQHFQTFIDQNLKNKSLLEAADHGHHRCVRVLLKNGADIEARRSNEEDSSKSNCLMIAIEKNHRETVLTILSHGRYGPESLRFVREKTTLYARKLVKKVEYTQPFVLLIRHMPDIAEWVLNKCALSQPKQGSDNSFNQMEVAIDFSRQQSGIDETDIGGVDFQHQISTEEAIVQKGTDYIMDNKFEILDSACQTTDDSEDDIYRWRQKTIKTINHPIQTMMDHDRTEMLNHNMVQTWIDHKLKDVIPDLIIYLLLYVLFLANLTIFTFLLPRPGPWNEYCQNETSFESAMNATAGNESTVSEG